jgi:hypothetical protein
VSIVGILSHADLKDLQNILPHKIVQMFHVVPKKNLVVQKSLFLTKVKGGCIF